MPDSVEDRLARIEATMATKTDLAALRDELRAELADVATNADIDIAALGRLVRQIASTNEVRGELRALSATVQ